MTVGQFGGINVTDYYAKQLEVGLIYQDFVVEKLYEKGIPIVGYSSKKYQYSKGENKNGYEIKFDNRRKETGNLYIEIAEKSDANNKSFVPSGIYRDDNAWLYIIGDYDKIYILSKKHLRFLFENNESFLFENSGSYFNFTLKDTPTSQGFLIPAKFAEEKLAILIINCNQN